MCLSELVNNKNILRVCGMEEDFLRRLLTNVTNIEGMKGAVCP